MAKFIPKSVFITGATSGLGHALALAYAEQGVRLFLSGRNEGRLCLIKEKCVKKGAEVYTQVVDVRNKEEMQIWAEMCYAITPIDLIIANAGISAGTAGGEESFEQLSYIMDVNVYGVYHTIYPFLSVMRKRKRGQIAIVSSLAGYRGLPSSPAYSASKAAIKVFGEALRGQESIYGVFVTVITPGYIRTPMTDVNNFPMPSIVSAPWAASYIKKCLQHNPARIVFPKLFGFFVWFLSCLSPSLTDVIFANLPKKPSLKDIK